MQVLSESVCRRAQRVGASLAVLAFAFFGGAAHAQIDYTITFEESQGYTTTKTYDYLDLLGNPQTTVPGAYYANLPPGLPPGFGIGNSHTGTGNLATSNANFVNANNATVIQTAVTNGGAQALRSDAATANQTSWGALFGSPGRYYSGPTSTAEVSVDINVPALTATPSLWGVSFFTINPSATSLNVVGAFGLAFSGQFINGQPIMVPAFLNDPTGQNVQFAPVPVAYNTWNRLTLRADWSTQTMTALLGGVPVFTNIPFAPGTTNRFGYAELSGLAANRVSSNDTAYFDNYRLNLTGFTAAPEPGSIGLLLTAVLPGAALLRRRK